MVASIASRPSATASGSMYVASSARSPSTARRRATASRSFHVAMYCSAIFWKSVMAQPSPDGVTASMTSEVMVGPRSPAYDQAHDNRDPATGRRAAPRVARAPPAEPARAVGAGQRVDPAPEFRGDRASQADQRDDPAADRALGRAAPGTQFAAARR